MDNTGVSGTARLLSNPVLECHQNSSICRNEKSDAFNTRQCTLEAASSLKQDYGSSGFHILISTLGSVQTVLQETGTKFTYIKMVLKWKSIFPVSPGKINTNMERD